MTAGAALNGLLAGTATTTTESVSPVAITSATEAGPTSLPTPAATLSEGGQVVESTSVLLLLNMATMNELVDDEEFGRDRLTLRYSVCEVLGCNSNVSLFCWVLDCRRYSFGCSGRKRDLR